MKLVAATVFLFLFASTRCNPVDISTLESTEKWQGDIILTENQEKFFEGKEESQGGRTGIIYHFYRWPKVDGLVYVPYTFAASAGFTSADISIIQSGLTEIMRQTCIRFVLKTVEEDFIKIINDDGCYSYLGRVGGLQHLSLSKNGCIHKGVLMHEFIHALGYSHMHNRYDRDDYVKINFENVDPKYQPHFQKVSNALFSDFDTTYDYESIMHYGRTAFSINGYDTIVTKDPHYANQIGQVLALSLGDLARLRNMYQC